MPLGFCLLPDELHSIAVARIADGQLPLTVPPTVYAGYGAGEPCDLCGQPIEPQQVDYEVADEPHHRSWEFHLHCYTVWQRECASHPDT